MPTLQDTIPSQLIELKKRLGKPALVRRFKESTIQYVASVVSQLIKGPANLDSSVSPTESDRQACFDAPLRADSPEGETVRQAFAEILTLVNTQNLKPLVFEALKPLAGEINASPSIKQALIEQGFVLPSKNTGQSQRSGQTGRSEQSQHSEQTGHSGRSGQSQRSEQTGHSGRSGQSQRSEQTGHSGRSGQSQRSQQTGHSGRSGQSQRSEQTGHSGRSGQSQRSQQTGHSGRSEQSQQSQQSQQSGHSGHSEHSEHSEQSQRSQKPQQTRERPATAEPKAAPEPAQHASAKPKEFDFFASTASQANMSAAQNFVVGVGLTQGPFLPGDRDNYLAGLFERHKKQEGNFFKTFFAAALDVLDGTLSPSGLHDQPTVIEVLLYAAQHHHPLSSPALLVMEKYVTLAKVAEDVLAKPGQRVEDKKSLEGSVKAIQTALKVLLAEVIKSPMSENAALSVKIFKAELRAICNKMHDKPAAKKMATAAMEVVGKLPVNNQLKSNMNFKCRSESAHRKPRKGGNLYNSPTLHSVPGARH